MDRTRSFVKEIEVVHEIRQILPLHTRMVFKYPSNKHQSAWCKQFDWSVANIPKFVVDDEHPDNRSFVTTNFLPNKIYQVEDDGNCLFRAISYVVSNTELNHACLRALAVEYIKDKSNAGKHKWIDLWLPEFDLELTKLPATNYETIKYGRTIHIIALSKLLHTEILVYEPGDVPKFELYTPDLVQSPGLHLKQNPDMPLIPLRLQGCRFDVIENFN